MADDCILANAIRLLRERGVNDPGTRAASAEVAAIVEPHIPPALVARLAAATQDVRRRIREGELTAADVTEAFIVNQVVEAMSREEMLEIGRSVMNDSQSPLARSVTECIERNVPVSRAVSEGVDRVLGSR
jgi:DNA-binding GntR family transcriptional regulator